MTNDRCLNDREDMEDIGTVLLFAQFSEDKGTVLLSANAPYKKEDHWFRNEPIVLLLWGAFFCIKKTTR